MVLKLLPKICKNNWKCICTVVILLFLYVQCLKFTGSIDEQEDSNLLTSEHDVISGVLREEFGPSYQAVYEPRSQTTRFTEFHTKINNLFYTKMWL